MASTSQKMLPLKPVFFYGKALPRPWIYDDVKLNDVRVDPPAPVNDAFIRWAKEAHWSMGGTRTKKCRMQGRTEGRINKLRYESEEDEEPVAPDSPKLMNLRKRIAAVDSPMQMKTRQSEASAKSEGLGKIGRRKVNCDSPAATVKTPKSESHSVPLRSSPRFSCHATSPSPHSPGTPAEHLSNTESPKPVAARIQRRVFDRPLPEAEESDSEVELDEFMRGKDRPLRRSTRVSAIRTALKHW